MARVAGAWAIQTNLDSKGKRTDMSEAAAEANGNGAEPEEKTVSDSKIRLLRKEWETAGSKQPTDGEREKLKAAYRKAKAELQKAEEVVKEARGSLSNVCKTIMLKTGARTLHFDGVDHVPMCHGETYFFRARSAKPPSEF